MYWSQGILVPGQKKNFAAMQNFFDQHNKKWPLMCMEFWDGWFNRWNEPIIRRDPDDLAESVKEALEIGSVNLYMFQGEPILDL